MPVADEGAATSRGKPDVQTECRAYHTRFKSTAQGAKTGPHESWSGQPTTETEIRIEGRLPGRLGPFPARGGFDLGSFLRGNRVFDSARSVFWVRLVIFFFEGGNGDGEYRRSKVEGRRLKVECRMADDE